MEDLPPFFKSLTGSRLINTAVTKCKLTDDDLIGYVYTRTNKNKVMIKNFYLSQKEHFNEVTILSTGFGVLIDFVTDDTKYFQDAHTHFNTTSVARAKASLYHQGIAFKVKGKKINRLNLFNKKVDSTVMRSDLFGCKIMTSFF
jgi:penicillin-binding protein-related factor A (putative recombinase)